MISAYRRKKTPLTPEEKKRARRETQHRWYESHIDEIREKKRALRKTESYRKYSREQRQRYRADPEFSLREREYTARYREKHREKIRERRRAEIRARYDDIGKIYFVQARSGPIKIGYTKQKPLYRLQGLQIGNHEELTLLATITPSTRKEEYTLHQRFRSDRIRGEWFRPSPALMALIANLLVTSS